MLIKRKLAQIYIEGLKEDFIKPIVTSDCFDVYHIFNVRHPKRDMLKEYLLKNEVKTDIHYPIPPHRQKSYARYIKRGVSYFRRNTSYDIKFTYLLWAFGK